jgi:ABC-type sugar transport system substrate-binding protein
MKKMMLLAAMLALTVLVVGAPAAMADNDRQDDRFEDCFFFDGVLICDDLDRDFFDGERFDFDGELDQDVEQEAESSDIDQSFTVTSEGDNSNQCAGIQGVANTGNAQTVLDLTQVDGDADDFEFDEVDSSVEVSPESSTTCDQQVNQAASASG